MVICDLSYLEIVAEKIGILGGKNDKNTKIKIDNSQIIQTATGGDVKIKIHKSSNVEIIASADALNSIVITATSA